MKHGILSVVVSMVASVVLGQPGPRVTELPLWPDGLPDSNGLSGQEEIGACIGNISTPTLTVHLPSDDTATGAAIVVTPGGGYGVVCADTEGKEIAEILVPLGVATIVLKYRLPNQHHLIPANDARRAIRTVRANAEQWNLDPHRIGVWGFSAGGHLASTVSTKFDAGQANADDRVERYSSRPDFSILFYPVITMELGTTHNGSRKNLLGPSPSDEMLRRYSNDLQVSADTPPTFLLHAADDRAVPIENSLRYYMQLLSHHVSARMVLYETGGHGPGAFRSNASWLPTFESWLDKQIGRKSSQ